jgi:hypothetical protein
VRLADLEAARWATPALLVALTAVSLFLRTRILNAGLWIDEGLSVGIAHHHLWSIPHLMRQDGSPPLYYMLLHVWIGWFGDGERTTHALSLVFALACIPLAYVVARALFGRRTGWFCAVIAALDPYLTYYAQETRMYSLLAFLSLIVAYAYVRGVLEGRRRYLALLAAGLAAELYTHNWGIFICLGIAAATLAFARERWRELALAAAGTALLYLPWVPTLLFQVRHTGAPWSSVPSFRSLLLSPGAVLAGDAPLLAFALAGGAGVVALARGGRREGKIAVTLAAAVGTALLSAWLLSQVSPAWTIRYLAIIVGPLFLVVALGLSRAGRLGLAALAIVVVYWAELPQRDDKSNVRPLTTALAPSVHRGDLMLVTHPEQVPVLRYYLGSGLHWATELGPVPDTQIFDWRDAVDRIDASSVRRDLPPVLDSVTPGGRLIVVSPVFRDYRAWKSRWTSRVYRTSREWTAAVDRDPRFRRVRVVQTNEILLKRNFFKPLQATVYVRRQ